MILKFGQGTIVHYFAKQEDIKSSIEKIMKNERNKQGISTLLEKNQMGNWMEFL